MDSNAQTAPVVTRPNPESGFEMVGVESVHANLDCMTHLGFAIQVRAVDSESEVVHVLDKSGREPLGPYMRVLRSIAIIQSII